MRPARPPRPARARKNTAWHVGLAGPHKTGLSADPDQGKRFYKCSPKLGAVQAPRDFHQVPPVLIEAEARHQKRPIAIKPPQAVRAPVGSESTLLFSVSSCSAARIDAENLCSVHAAQPAAPRAAQVEAQVVGNFDGVTVHHLQHLCGQRPNFAGHSAHPARQQAAQAVQHARNHHIIQRCGSLGSSNLRTLKDRNQEQHDHALTQAAEQKFHN